MAKIVAKADGWWRVILVNGVVGGLVYRQLASLFKLGSIVSSLLCTRGLCAVAAARAAEMSAAEVTVEGDPSPFGTVTTIVKSILKNPVPSWARFFASTSVSMKQKYVSTTSPRVEGAKKPVEVT